MLDNDKLIAMVQDRKPLWDINCKNYHNRDVARKLWQEIAEEMNSTGIIVKARWQNLRDNFRREHVKCTKSPDGTTSWKYYDQLLFIADMFKTRKDRSFRISTGQAFSSSQQGDIKSEDEDIFVPLVDLEVSNCSTEVMDMEALSSEEDPRMSTDSKQFKNQSNQFKSKVEQPDPRLGSDAINQFLQLEMKKMEQLERIHRVSKSSEEMEQDEDYHFLMSLLPHLRQVPKSRKLSIRMLLQQVLMNVTDGEGGQTTNSNHSEIN